MIRDAAVCEDAAATRATRGAALLGLLAAFATAGCSIAHLSFAEVERDLDAIVKLEQGGDGLQLVYADEARQARWWTRALLLAPIKPVLGLMFDSTSPSVLENPSGEVRELLAALAPKAGDDIDRTASTVQRLGYVAQLDGSALNRIVALDGLATLAQAHDFDLVEGLERGVARLRPLPELPRWIQEFQELGPKGRVPGGEPLAAPAAARYRAVLTALTAQPLAEWWDRMGLVNNLAEAVSLEPDPSLRDFTRAQLLNATRHVMQWTIVAAVQGQEPQWVDVRMRALELLHRSGGPDSVPLLLALMANSPGKIAVGEPQFDPDTLMRLRLIHMCGQLDRERAEQSVTLAGREEWQATAPVDFLARIVLDESSFLSPLTLPARQALAQCLGRPSVDLYVDDDDHSWVREWYDEYRRRS